MSDCGTSHGLDCPEGCTKTKHVVGTALWRVFSEVLQESWCLVRGGHVPNEPYAPMACRRCCGSGYDPTLRKVWQRMTVRRLYWGQVNRYRDWLRPLALAWPRLAGWTLGIYACTKCGSLRSWEYRTDGCDTCAFTAFSQWARKGLARKRRTPRIKDVSSEAPPLERGTV